MTDEELDRRLRAWYRTDIGEGEVAPLDLRAGLAAIPVLTPFPKRRLGRGRTMTLLAAAAVLAIGGGLIAGGGSLRLATVAPTPSGPPSPSAPVPSEHAGPSPSAAVPSEHAGPSPSAVASALGGGPLLAIDAPVDAAGVPIDMSAGPYPKGTYPAFTLDAGTGKRTDLGTLSYTGHWNWPLTVQWAGAGRPMLITNRYDGLLALDTVTAEGRAVATACCSQPDVDHWLLSPQGDLLAGLHQDTHFTHPGLEGMTDRSDAVVITDVQGRLIRQVPLPRSMEMIGDRSARNLSWSADETSLLMAGCRPCNYAMSDQAPNEAAHGHLYIVPLDGSPVRELQDEDNGWFWGPRWSPDHESIISSHLECESGGIAPYCFQGHTSIVSVRVADGTQTLIADVPHLVWRLSISPDGRWIAYSVDGGGVFVMALDGSDRRRLADGSSDLEWSPDSQWIEYDQRWIVPLAGGEPRDLGTTMTVAW